MDNNKFQKTPCTDECYVRISDLKKAILENPYDPAKGEIASYLRYLKYNTPFITDAWIPCSERLPEKHQMVITTIKGVDLFRECADKNFFEALATAKKRTLVSVGYLGDDGWYGADGFPQIIPTVAWMPLPEPYKAESEDKE